MGRNWSHVLHEVCNVCLRQGMLPMGYVTEPFGQTPESLGHGPTWNSVGNNVWKLHTRNLFGVDNRGRRKMVDRIERWCDDSEERRRRLSVESGTAGGKRNMPTQKQIVNTTMKSPVFVFGLLRFTEDGHFFPNAILSAAERSFPTGRFG